MHASFLGNKKSPHGMGRAGWGLNEIRL